MATIRSILVCIVLAGISAVAFAGSLLLWRVSEAARMLPLEAHDTRVQLLSLADARINELLLSVNLQMDAISAATIGELELTRRTVDRRISDTLQRADRAISVVEGTSQHLAPAIDAVAPAVAQLTGDLHGTLAGLDRVSEEARITVHDLHPQALGLVAGWKVVGGETAQTMRDVRNAVPGFLAQGQAIAGNAQTATVEFKGVAANLNRLTKPKWYDRLLGYGLNGIVIYRNLNPTTSVVVKGTQFLSR